jgi:hypothetical protein
VSFQNWIEAGKALRGYESKGHDLMYWIGPVKDSNLKKSKMMDINDLRNLKKVAQF